MLEVTKNAPQIAIMQLGRAFENFFAKRSAFPVFRRKGRNDRFTLSNDQFRIKGKRIRLPKLGWVRMCETLRCAGHIVSGTISRVADHWYASITVNSPDLSMPRADNQGTVGVDLGISALATLSTGEKIVGPKALHNLLERLERQSRSVSRKAKGSRNRAKAKLKLAKLHDRIASIRRDSLHKLSNSLTHRFHMIGIADLNVKGMMANGRLSRAIADRLDMLDLGTRQWTCPSCQTQHDRDVNAAINLSNMAVSSTVIAYGGEGAGLAREREAKPAPVKQESNGKVSST